MTNKEAMCKLPDEQFFAKIEWLLHEYGRNYIDTRMAVIDWLGQEAKHGMSEGITADDKLRGDPERTEEEEQAAIALFLNRVRQQCERRGKATDWIDQLQETE